MNDKTPCRCTHAKLKHFSSYVVASGARMTANCECRKFVVAANRVKK